MGLGLGVKSQGKHIAFTAGTGILAFLDFVAYLMIRLIERNGGPAILTNVPKDSMLQSQSVINTV